MTKYKSYLIPEDELLMEQLMIAKPGSSHNALRMSSEPELALYTQGYLDKLGKEGLVYAGYKIIGTARRVYCIFYKAED